MKKSKINISIIVSLIFTIFLFILYKNEHFALDTYSFQNDISNNINWYFMNGRLVMSLFLFICNVLNLSFKTIKFVSLIIALVSLFLSVIILDKYTKDKIKNNVIRALVVSLIIYNPFIFEFFLFPEYTGIMAFSLLMSVLAYVYISKYFNDKKIKNLILSFVFAFICVSSYQGTIGCFVSLTTYYIITNYKNIKQFIIQNVYTISIYSIVSLVSLIITKICGLSRVNTTGYNLIKSIISVSQGLVRLLSSSAYVFPKFYYLAIIMLILVLIVFAAIKSNNSKFILLVMYLVLMITLFSLAPQFLVRYDMAWVVARSNISLGMLFGILALVYFSINLSKDKYMYISFSILILTIILQFIGWYFIRDDHYYINVADRIIAKDIINSIREYELTNQKITKISVLSDKSPVWTYPGVTTSFGDTNLSAFTVDWATHGILEYYSGDEYKLVSAPEDIKDKCSNSNWDEFDIEQLTFDGDTLHICNY